MLGLVKLARTVLTTRSLLALGIPEVPSEKELTAECKLRQAKPLELGFQLFYCRTLDIRLASSPLLFADFLHRRLIPMQWKKNDQLRLLVAIFERHREVCEHNSEFDAR